MRINGTSLNARNVLINYRGPLVLPSALSLQLTLCNISPTSDYTRQAASEAADIAIDLRFNDKQVSIN